jgi:hypothetical protein
MSEFDLIQSPIGDAQGNSILVSKRVNLQTGEPIGALQEAIPDALDFRRGLIVDDKPVGRALAKDRQEIIRFIRAFEVREGTLPQVIAIQRYDPDTSAPIVTELYSPFDFLPSSGE